ncbi:hypothetical protein SESBI_11815 [Sesbania bispinosa]|nr:hypothetical protein SESBI_11815 [Sesbania bispinosa]
MPPNHRHSTTHNCSSPPKTVATSPSRFTSSPFAHRPSPPELRLLPISVLTPPFAELDSVH